MTTTQDHQSTAIPCPSWCTTDHIDMPAGAGFHATGDLGSEMPCPIAFRLWQDDRDNAPQGVVFAGQFLTGDQAHEVGLELVRAADKLRRAARA